MFLCLVVFISYRKMSEYEIKMFILSSIYSMLYTERKNIDFSPKKFILTVLKHLHTTSSKGTIL